MGETEDFLAAVLPRQVEAGRAVHNGQPAQWVSMWSQADPVTLFGAWVCKTGWSAIGPFNDWLGTQFRDCSSYEIDLVAAGASGDLAYTVAYERTTASVKGRPAEPYTLRVTHVYRREEGEWQIVHRHGDSLPGGRSETPADY